MTTTQTKTPVANVNWFEIPVSDLAKSSALYGAMLAQPLQHVDFGGVPHAMLANKGALVVDPKRPPRPGTGTLIYLNASDGVARALSRAVEAGAKIVQPLTSIAPHGAIALIEDLDGNVVGLHEEQA